MGVRKAVQAAAALVALADGVGLHAAFMLPGTPALNSIALGGATPSRLLLPVLPDPRRMR